MWPDGLDETEDMTCPRLRCRTSHSGLGTRYDMQVGIAADEMKLAHETAKWGYPKMDNPASHQIQLISCL